MSGLSRCLLGQGQVSRYDEANKRLVQDVDPKEELKEDKAENSGAYSFETIARE